MDPQMSAKTPPFRPFQEYQFDTRVIKSKLTRQSPFILINFSYFSKLPIHRRIQDIELSNLSNFLAHKRDRMGWRRHGGCGDILSGEAGPLQIFSDPVETSFLTFDTPLESGDRAEHFELLFRAKIGH